MKNFWIEFGINSGIAALSGLVASKVGSQDLQDAAQAAIASLHNFLEVWHAEKSQLPAK